MNRPTRKLEPKSEAGAPGKESAHLKSNNSKNVASPGPGSKTTLLRVWLHSAVGGSNLLEIARVAGPMPATATRRNSRGVVRFFTVPDSACCDDSRILGAGITVDVVSVSSAWAAALGELAAAPAWLARLVEPRGGR